MEAGRTGSKGPGAQGWDLRAGEETENQRARGAAGCRARGERCQVAEREGIDWGQEAGRGESGAKVVSIK